MITKKIFAVLLNHSFAKSFFFFFFTKAIFNQGAFKNIQGPPWKIQGLSKDIPQFFNSQGLFKARANHEGILKYGQTSPQWPP